LAIIPGKKSPYQKIELGIPGCARREKPGTLLPNVSSDEITFHFIYQAFI
jgi:hypothetical protein